MATRSSSLADSQSTHLNHEPRKFMCTEGTVDRSGEALEDGGARRSALTVSGQ